MFASEFPSTVLNTETVLFVYVLNRWNEWEKVVFHPHKNGSLDIEKILLLGIGGKSSKS